MSVAKRWADNHAKATLKQKAKSAAKLMGLGFREVLAHFEVGDKWCRKGKHWVPGESLYQTLGGKSYCCKDCRVMPFLEGDV